MTSTFTIIVQIIATILQVLNSVNVAQLPAKWQVAFTGLLTILQAVQGILAHYYTPAGMPIVAATGQVKDSTGTTVATVPTTKS